MNFEQFMKERFPSLAETEKEVIVNLTWLKGFWLAAQKAKEQNDSD